MNTFFYLIDEVKMENFYRLPQPAFDSELTSLLFEIERYRASIGTGTTSQEVYVELHLLFDTVMSVISARIEGNHTTVYEAIDAPAGESPSTTAEKIREITNIRETSRFIDELSPSDPLSHSLVRELHSRTVSELDAEGDPTPGSYREQEVAILDSSHRPPSWVNVHSMMTDLLEFANRDFPLQQQILQIALAHHRFVWIHPFRNGNGRAARLFTYAMLRRTVFADRGQIALNPTSVFGNHRGEYISALEDADGLKMDGTLAWTTFFAKGIRDDLARVYKLQDRSFVNTELIEPAIAGLARDGVISADTQRVLGLLLERAVIKAGDLEPLVGGTAPSRSRLIRDLLDRNLLRRSDAGPRFYKLSLSSGPLAHRVIRQLNVLGYLPVLLSRD